MESLFQSQINTLRAKGLSEELIAYLKDEQTCTLGRANMMRFERGRIPFLPIIPLECLALYAQLSLVRSDNIVGDYSAFLLTIVNVVETPRQPYYIFDVEDGKSMCGVAPMQAEKLMSIGHRRGLSNSEVIALCLHTDVLSRHNVDAVGSRYEENGKMGVCCLVMKDEKPEVEISWDDVGGHKLWGAASCRRNAEAI